VLTLGGICVPPTVNYLQYLDTGSTLTAVGLFSCRPHSLEITVDCFRRLLKTYLFARY